MRRATSRPRAGRRGSRSPPGKRAACVARTAGWAGTSSSRRVQEVRCGGLGLPRDDAQLVAERDDAAEQRPVAAHRDAETDARAARLLDVDMPHDAQRLEIGDYGR